MWNHGRVRSWKVCPTGDDGKTYVGRRECDSLIGERGREVREFIERDLGPEGLKKSVVIVSTSDKSPIMRMRGAFLATTIAEYFRDQGKDVLLLMDSVTRFCMAQREIGLSLGEPPASKGYTPSVFSIFLNYWNELEWRPKREVSPGSIPCWSRETIWTIRSPIRSRSILDGHIVLSRKIAQRNHFPAIDVLQSTSRVMRAVVTPEHVSWAGQVKDWLATYSQAEDLINIGAYVRGSNRSHRSVCRCHRSNQEFFVKQADERSYKYELIP